MTRKEAAWQRAIYLVSNPVFKAALVALRKEINIPLIGFRSKRLLDEWLAANIYVTGGERLEGVIDLTVARIISKPELHLSLAWHEWVKQYAYRNKLTHNYLPIHLAARIEQDKFTGQRIILLEVSQDTTEKDFINQWSEIEHLRKLFRLPASSSRVRKANPDNLRRGKLAYELWVNGLSYDKIAEILERRGFEGVVMADDAKTIIRNFIKQAGI